jgi:hypothetical protein
VSRCLYPDRRLCPLCSARGRRITIGGTRVPGALRSIVVDCRGCGVPIAQERLGRPRQWCARCLASNTKQARSGREQAGAVT